MAGEAPTRRARGATGQPARIAPDVYAAARRVAARESRSATQQIDYWLRIGQGYAMQQSASRRRIEAVLTGTLPMSALRADERLVVNAELDAAVTVQAAATPLGASATGDGVTTVALDEQGRLVEYRPDGTSVVLEPGSDSGTS